MSVFIKGLNRFIKGMKMPKLEKTYKVRLYKAVDGRIIVTACGIKDNLLRPVGEVIEIPTPHGRLIDADKLIEEVYPFVAFGNVDYAELKKIANKMTAVIEAEE